MSSNENSYGGVFDEYDVLFSMGTLINSLIGGMLIGDAESDPAIGDSKSPRGRAENFSIWAPSLDASPDVLIGVAFDYSNQLNIRAQVTPQ